MLLLERLIPFFVVLFVTGVNSKDRDLTPPVQGYGVEPPTLEIRATPDSPSITHEGTIEEAYARLLKINPDYDDDFANTTIPSVPQTSNEAETETETELVSRGLQKRKDKVLCYNVASAHRDKFTEGIKYLRKLKGRPARGPGPGNCTRVSCSWNAAIWWCNDNPFTKILPSFNNIADGAQLILNSCASNPMWVGGQDFHDDNWNVIVTYGLC